MDQKELIHRIDWDYLIVLDDCRFDYFEEVYDDYIDPSDVGSVMSQSFQTPNWFKAVFDKIYPEIVYISGNPVVNSKGIGAFGHDPLNAHKKFYKLIDTWDHKWNDNLAVTLPGSVTDDALGARNKYSDKRQIIHYLQPHEPFINLLRSKNNGGEDNTNDKGSSSRFLGYFNKTVFAKNALDTIRDHAPRKVKDRLNSFLSSKNGKYFRQMVFRIFGMPPRMPRDVAEIHSVQKLRESYRKNIELVLGEVQRFLEEIDEGKVVITADHGEALGGEEGFGHKQMEVPWVELNE